MFEFNYNLVPNPAGVVTVGVRSEGHVFRENAPQTAVFRVDALTRVGGKLPRSIMKNRVRTRV